MPGTSRDLRRETKTTTLSEVFSKDGTLSALNDIVYLDCPGTSGAVISLSGNFSGIITVTGSSKLYNEATVFGGRLLFKSGVGSLGVNFVEEDGTDGGKEYRIITNGKSIKIQATAYNSGTANITITASINTGVNFINGPVHSAFEQAVRNSRGFLDSTGVTPVQAGNVLACILTNPIDSGVNLFLVNRLFSNNALLTDSNLEYLAYGNPTAVLATQRTGINLKSGGVTSLAIFKYEALPIIDLVMGGIIGTGEVLPNGQPYSRPVDFVLPPGGSVGFTIDGEGQNLSKAVRMSIVLEWYEESVL